jgi:hypothetical protein
MNNTFKRGTIVLCVISKFLPERVSPRTGKVKPWRNLTEVVTAKVVADRGDDILVKVGNSNRTRSFFRHEVVREIDLMTFRNGLGG